MSSTRKIPTAYNQATPSKISVLLAAFGLGSYKSKSPQESKEIIEASKQDVLRSQAILAKSDEINEAAMRVLARKS